MGIPWARPRVSYTIEMERGGVLRNLSDRSISATAKSLGIGHWMVADIVCHRVKEAKRKLDLSNVTKIYVDETLFKKGHDYVTVVCEIARIRTQIPGFRSGRERDDAQSVSRTHSPSRTTVRVCSSCYPRRTPHGNR